MARATKASLGATLPDTSPTPQPIFKALSRYMNVIVPAVIATALAAPCVGAKADPVQVPQLERANGYPGSSTCQIGQRLPSKALQLLSLSPHVGKPAGGGFLRFQVVGVPVLLHVAFVERAVRVQEDAHVVVCVVPPPDADAGGGVEA
jgi:hypothetical protein